MIEVVAGIIYKEGKFLIAQRNRKKSQGGLWEFPGGKVEQGETYEEALIREIKEEFNADIQIKQYVGEKTHHYPEKDVHLSFYTANLLSSKIELLEHEAYQWITKEEKQNFKFAGADEIVFELIP